MLWEDKTFDKILFSDFYFDEGLIAYYAQLRAYKAAQDRDEGIPFPVRPKPNPVNLGFTVEAFQETNDATTISRLRHARMYAGLTQRELARLMGLSQQSIAKLERSGSDPKLSTLRKYANTVGLLITHELTCLGNFDPHWREKEAEAELLQAQKEEYENSEEAKAQAELAELTWGDNLA